MTVAVAPLYLSRESHTIINSSHKHGVCDTNAAPPSPTYSPRMPSVRTMDRKQWIMPLYTMGGCNLAPTVRRVRMTSSGREIIIWVNPDAAPDWQQQQQQHKFTVWPDEVVVSFPLSPSYHQQLEGRGRRAV